jgi:hypothetical protein
MQEKAFNHLVEIIGCPIIQGDITKACNLVLRFVLQLDFATLLVSPMMTSERFMG